MRAGGQGLVFAICFSGVHAEKTGPQKDRWEYPCEYYRVPL